MVIIICDMCSCNRYDAQRKAGNLLDHRRQEVMNEHKDWEEVSKFLHYHERYKEHINSYKVRYSQCVIANIELPILCCSWRCPSWTKLKRR